MSAVRDISRMPPFGPKSEYVNAIIETPKGSRTKFKYDEEHGLFMFDKAMPIGQSFPFDYGFLPSTKSEDGDPLDVLVLTEEPTFVGCLVKARLLGVIEAEQTENGKTERNDRLISVAAESHTHASLKSLRKMDSTLIREIEQFFISYNKVRGKKFRLKGHKGPTTAKRLIKKQTTKRK